MKQRQVKMLVTNRKLSYKLDNLFPTQSVSCLTCNKFVIILCSTSVVLVKANVLSSCVLSFLYLL